MKQAYGNARERSNNALKNSRRDLTYGVHLDSKPSVFKVVFRDFSIVLDLEWHVGSAKQNHPKDDATVLKRARKTYYHFLYRRPPFYTRLKKHEITSLSIGSKYQKSVWDGINTTSVFFRSITMNTKEIPKRSSRCKILSLFVDDFH